MEHDQRACSQCGASAGGFHYCPSCLAPIDSPAAIPTRAEAQQSLVAASNGESGGIPSGGSAATVHVEADEGPAEDASAASTLLEGGVSDPSAAPRDVARLEDVLTIADGSAAPAKAPELLIRADELLGRTARPPWQVARLEDVLITPSPNDEPAEQTIADTTAKALETTEVPIRRDDHGIAPRTAAAASVEPAQDHAQAAPVEETELRPKDRPALAPRYVVAHRLRAAFLHEQTSAFEQGLAFEPDDESEPAVQEAPQAAVLLAPAAPDLTTSETNADPCAGDDQTARNQWLAALCLLALIGLVVALIGRAPRRVSGAKLS